MKRIKPLRYRPPGAERSGAELGGSVLVGLGMEEVWWWRRFGGGEGLVVENVWWWRRFGGGLVLVVKWSKTDSHHYHMGA